MNLIRKLLRIFTGKKNNFMRDHEYIIDDNPKGDYCRVYDGNTDYVNERIFVREKKNKNVNFGGEGESPARGIFSRFILWIIRL